MSAARRFFYYACTSGHLSILSGPYDTQAEAQEVASDILIVMPPDGVPPSLETLNEKILRFHSQ